MLLSGHRNVSLDFSYKSRYHLTQSCRSTCLGHFIISYPIGVFLKQRLTFRTSQSPSLHASLASLAFYTASGILCEFWEMNTDIRDNSISTPPYPTLHLEKIVPQLLSLFLASAVTATTDTSKSFFQLKRKCDIFSSTVTGGKNKEWRLSVEGGNWNRMHSGGALKIQLD